MHLATSVILLLPTASTRVAFGTILSSYKCFDLPTSLIIYNCTHIRNKFNAPVTAKLGMTHQLPLVHAPRLNIAVKRVFVTFYLLYVR